MLAGKPFGELAVLYEIDSGGSDPRRDARRARALASELRARAPGADVVVGGASVLVDPSPVAAAAISARDASQPEGTDARGEEEGALRSIDVVYDGEDLGELARDLGWPVERVIEAHLAPTYEVEVLGFLPGFAYLGEVEPALRRPRRASPRHRVPARSVAIAGRYTGVYPSASPGGWHLLGEARGVTLFDPASEPPMLLAPGDRVRFRRVERGVDAPRPAERPPRAGGILEVLTSPPHATLQDLGRRGRRAQGIPSSGAWDVEAHLATNRALQNADGCATLELPLDRFRARALGDLFWSVDGAEPQRAREGDVIEVAPTDRAVRYLGVDGGFAGDLVLGSRATLVSSGFGGLGGRRVRRGDHLARALDARLVPMAHAPHSEPLGAQREAPLAVTPGPHLARFAEGELERFLATDFVVSTALDRTGTRLDGAKLEREGADAGAPTPMIRGAIQVSTDGTPIVLGPDAATTGGYPVIAVVTERAQSAFARLRPGSPVRFSLAR